MYRRDSPTLDAGSSTNHFSLVTRHRVSTLADILASHSQPGSDLLVCSADLLAVFSARATSSQRAATTVSGARTSTRSNVSGPLRLSTCGCIEYQIPTTDAAETIIRANAAMPPTATLTPRTPRRRKTSQTA